MIKHVYANQGQVRRAASEAASAAQRVSVGRVAQAAEAGATSVAGGELATAFGDVGDALQERVRAFGYALENWASDVRCAAETYEVVDSVSAEGLQRAAWSPV